MKQKTWKRTKLKMEQEQVVRRNKFALKKVKIQIFPH